MNTGAAGLWIGALDAKLVGAQQSIEGHGRYRVGVSELPVGISTG